MYNQLNLMQDLLKQIFEKACEEIPHRLCIFGNEKVIMYRGFRISETDGRYVWQDIRYDSFYDQVDPIITEHVLKNGFLKTLTEMMVHNDKERLYFLQQDVSNNDKMMKYWTLKSSENYRNYKKSETGILSNANLTPEQIEVKLKSLNIRYLQRKSLYVKKRRILKEERLKIESKITFIESRVKIYK